MVSLYRESVRFFVSEILSVFYRIPPMPYLRRRVLSKLR